MTSTTYALPFNAFPPTTDAVVNNWFEVAAHYDTRSHLPRAMAVAAITVGGLASVNLAGSCVEIELPGGAAMPLDSTDISSNVQTIAFPCRWRINKPPTNEKVTFAVWGLGVTVMVQDGHAGDLS